MKEINIVGLDTAKSVYQLHGDDAAGKPVLSRRLKRREVVPFFGKLASCTVALEACGASHHWGRELIKLGHKVKLVPPGFVKRFQSGSRKTDAIDARALALAGASPELRAVPVKEKEQQAGLSLLGARRLLVRQHTQTGNALRGHLAEMGLVARAGEKGLEELIARVESGEAELPALFTTAIAALVATLRQLEEQIKRLSAALASEVSAKPAIKRLTSAQGVGPVIALSFALKVPNPSRFASGRECAAWLGLTPNERSSGGKRKLTSISKAGDEDLRALLVQGGAALATVAKRNPLLADPWIVALLKRRPFKVAIVAIAARIARTLWAMQRDQSLFRPWRERASKRPAAA